jgi:hypothetical protein
MASQKWWAVELDNPHVGKTIAYVQASSRQLAGETFPGSKVLGGPYATSAAAEKAFPQGSHGTVPSDTGPPVASDAPVELPDPLGGIEQIGAALRAFWDGITDWHLWASLGWITLGVFLMWAGLRMWLGKPIIPKGTGAVAMATGDAPPVIPVPV